MHVVFGQAAAQRLGRFAFVFDEQDSHACYPTQTVWRFVLFLWLGRESRSRQLKVADRATQIDMIEQTEVTVEGLRAIPVSVNIPKSAKSRGSPQPIPPEPWHPVAGRRCRVLVQSQRNSGICLEICLSVPTARRG